MIWKYVVDLNLELNVLGFTVAGYERKSSSHLRIIRTLRPVGIFHPDFINLAVF